MTNERLYACQDLVMAKVFGSRAALFHETDIILAGGTALSRCYLHHRISYDLDFFVSRRFDPQLIMRRLKSEGIFLFETETESDPNFVSQLLGLVEEGGEEIKISFVEDVYSDMFPAKNIEGIPTETIEGLYHRKVRTLSGAGETISSIGRSIIQGGRQTARDLFDLYVLGNEVKSLVDFINEVNSHGANIPEIAVESGIKRMPWIDLMDEFETLEVADRYKGLGLLDIKRYFDDVLDISKERD